MALPVLQASGAIGTSTSGGLTVTLPAHQAGDILLVATCIFHPNTVGSLEDGVAPTGWTRIHVADHRPGGGASDVDAKYELYWRRATAANHTFAAARVGSWDTGTDGLWHGRGYVIRGAGSSGDPWDTMTGIAQVFAGANGTYQALSNYGSERLRFGMSWANETPSPSAGPTGTTLNAAVTVTTGTDGSHRTWTQNDVGAVSAGTITRAAPSAGRSYTILEIVFRPDNVAPNLYKYRFRNTGVGETGASWIANENTDVTLAKGSTFRLRWGLNNEGTKDIAGGGVSQFNLQYRVNGGAWQVISGSSAVQTYLDAAITNNGATTEQFAGSRTFSAGKLVSVNPGIATANFTLSNALVAATGTTPGETEYEMALQIPSGASLNSGDQVEFRLEQQGGGEVTHTAFPKVTIGSAGTAASDTRDVRITGTILSDQSYDVRILGHIPSEQAWDARTFGTVLVNEVWNARLTGRADLDRAYEARLTGKVTLDQAYDTRIRGTADLAESYHVRATGTILLPQAYDARIQGKADLPQSYDARLTGVADSGEAWAVRISAHIPTSEQWETRVRGQADYATAYDVRVQPQADSDITYGVRLVGRADSDLAQSVAIQGAADLAEAWSVRLIGASPEAELAESYEIRVTGRADTDAIYAARITGRLDTLDLYDARVTGSADNNEARDSRVTGTADLAVSRDIFVTGQYDTTSATDVKLIGQAGSDITREARLFAHIPVETTQDVFVTGKVSAVADVAYNVHLTGTADASQTYDVRAIGRATSDTTYSAALAGQAVAVLATAAHVIGQAPSDVAWSVSLTGAADAPASYDVRLRAQADISVSQEARVVGRLDSSVARDVIVSGQAAQVLAVEARVRGTADTSESYGARVTGQAASDHSVEARISGHFATSLSTEVRVTGRVPSQFLRPQQDITVGTWHDTPLYEKIDEAVADNSDFITSAVNPATPDVCEVLFTTGNTPEALTDHIIRYGYRASGGTGINLTVRLMEGGTEIASWIHTNISSEVIAEQELTTIQAGNITNYGNLRLRFEAVMN